MAISHVCNTCGTELSRVRARVDLGLWLVTCPSCGATAVRRRPFLLARRRQGRRLALAVITLFVQLVLLAGSLGAARATIWVVTNELDAVGIHNLLSDALELLRDEHGPRFVISVYLILAGTAIGVWLRTALSRWPFWAAWLAWTALLLTVTSRPEIVAAVERLYWRLGGWHDFRPGRHSIEWFLRFQVALLLAIIALLTMPIGAAGLRLWKGTRRARWIRRLRRARASRGRS